MEKNKFSKVCKILCASLFMLVFSFTSCDGLFGGGDEPGNKQYVEKISNLTYLAGAGSITFKWTNPSDENFAGVNVYKDSVLAETIAKDKAEITFTGLDHTTSYVFTFKATRTNADGVVEESVNELTKTMQLGAFAPKYEYIGYGYDVINGEFFCATNGLKKKKIIQFSEDFPVKGVTPNTAESKSIVDRSYKAYHDQLSTSLGVSAGYAGFSGCISADLSLTENNSEETCFATTTSVNRKYREYIGVSDYEIADLKQHLTPEFKKAINDSSVSPEKIFADYGTHVMLDTTIGGRFVINYTYVNKECESIQNIKTAVEANYSGLATGSVKASAEYDKSSKMSDSNTTIKGYTRGGKGAVFSNSSDASASLTEWTDSLDNEKTWSLIDSEKTIDNENSLTGIWLYADTEARQNEIKDKYISLLSANKELFDKVQVQKWVKAVHIYDSECGGNKNYKQLMSFLEGKLNNKVFKIVGQEEAEKVSLIDADGKTKTENNLISEKTEIIKKYDLMKGASNNYVYLIMEYTTNKAEALTGIYGNSSGNFDKAKDINFRTKEAKKADKYNAELWQKVMPIDSNDYDYRGGSGSRVLFVSTKESRKEKDNMQDTTPHRIKEIAVYNEDRGNCSATDYAKKFWTKTEDGNGNDIGKDTGGDTIYFQIFYDTEDK